MTQFNNDIIIGRQSAIRENIEKSFSEDIYLSQEEADVIEKGGKPAQLGEKRLMGGRWHVKTAQGWKYVGKETGAKAQSHIAAHAPKKDDAKPATSATPAPKKDDKSDSPEAADLKQRIAKLDATIKSTDALMKRAKNKAGYMNQKTKLMAQKHTLQTKLDDLDKPASKKASTNEQGKGLSDKDKAFHEANAAANTITFKHDKNAIVFSAPITGTIYGKPAKLQQMNRAVSTMSPYWSGSVSVINDKPGLGSSYRGVNIKNDFIPDAKFKKILDQALKK